MLMQRVRELVLFAVAGAIGYTFYSLNIPIPFMFAGLLLSQFLLMLSLQIQLTPLVQMLLLLMV